MVPSSESSPISIQSKPLPLTISHLHPLSSLNWCHRLNLRGKAVHSLSVVFGRSFWPELESFSDKGLELQRYCWEVGPKLEELCGLARREKEAGIFSEPEVDIFMKATSMGGVESSLITDYTLREDCKLRDLVVKDGMEINNVIVNGKQKQPIISDDSNEAMKHAFELFNV
ncbi:unnamed protein product [Prunus armeniaca]